MIVKICGLTRLDDIECAIDAGADLLGFVFAPSPRQIDSETVASFSAHIPEHIKTVGVFVNETRDTIVKTIEMCGLSYVQLHGEERPEFCQSIGEKAVKALSVSSRSDVDVLSEYSCSFYILDAYDPVLRGGTGKTFNHEYAVYAKKYGNIIVAGGLTVENISSVIRNVRPYGIDVSGGVEKEKGIKDHALLKTFIHRAKEA